MLNLANGGFDALRFAIAGDNQVYEVHINTLRTQAAGSSYTYTFTAPHGTTMFLIPFEQFLFNGTPGQPLEPSNAFDVMGIIWTTTGTAMQNINLSISDVSFERMERRRPIAKNKHR